MHQVRVRAIHTALLLLSILALGCLPAAQSKAPLTPSVSLAQVPGGAKSFEFCLTPAKEVHLGNALWMSFFAANEYAHGLAVAPMLNELGFHNPDHPGDLTWPDCLADLRQLRAAEKQAKAQLEKALGTDAMRPVARSLVPKDLAWGSCAKEYLYQEALRVDAFPAAGFQHQLVREQHPGAFLQFFTAGKIHDGGRSFRDASTQVAFARHRDKKLVVIAFRGTEPGQAGDLVTDAKLWKVPLDKHGYSAEWGSVHAGFLGAFQSVEPLLMQKLAEVAERGDRIWITGHSLGGALATMMTARLLRERDAGGPLDVAGLYTFGSPRVGNTAFAKAFGESAARHKVHTVRVRNGDDLVTSVPGLVLDYQHVGTLLHVQEEQLSFAPSKDPPYDGPSMGDHASSGIAHDGTEHSGYFRRLRKLYRRAPYADYWQCRDGG